MYSFSGRVLSGMTPIVNRRDVVSVLVGALAFAAVTVAVTAALDSLIAFSLLVGLPVGFTVGIAAVLLTYAGLTYRHERRGGTPFVRTTRRLRAALAGTGLVAFVFAAAAALFALGDTGTGVVVLWYGTPAALVVGVVTTYLLTRPTTSTAARPTASGTLAGGATALVVGVVVTAALAAEIGLYLALLAGVALGLGAAAIAYRLVGARTRPFDQASRRA